MEKLLEAVKELLRLLDGNPCTQYSGEGEFKHEHVLFDNIDRDRIAKVRALVEAAEQMRGADSEGTPCKKHGIPDCITCDMAGE